VKRVLGIGFVLVALSAARAEAPRTEELMAGTPPPADRQVTQANSMAWPYTVWAFQHIESIFPTTTADRGDGPVRELASAPADLSAFSFADPSGKTRNVTQFLEDQHIDAVLVWSDGKLRQEIYRNGETARTRHIMFSVTKSFTGLVAEMLIAEGRLDDTKRVSDYVPEMKGSAYEDATVRNVLDMEVGIDFSEIYDDPSSSIFQFSYAAGFRPVPPGVKAFPSLYEFLPSLRKKGEHGRDFHYVTANSEVLGWVIERITGKGFAHTFDEMIYSKLGAERDAFYMTDPHGKAVSGGGLSITGRDALRLAVMMAQKGRFNGEQIVPAAVVEKIAAGGTPRPSLWGNEHGGRDNSYKSQWYFHHPTGTVAAEGIHGQVIAVSPQRNVAMVVQSSYPDADGAFFGVTLAYFEHLARYLTQPKP
jgi:CubicO group peptidase (beta-lactamase class C family)